MRLSQGIPLVPLYSVGSIDLGIEPSPGDGRRTATGPEMVAPLSMNSPRRGQTVFHSCMRAGKEARACARIALVAVMLAAVALAAPSAAHAVTLPSGFYVHNYAQGLNAPTGVAFAPGGRTFVAEKAGVVRVVVNGTLQPDPVYDLSAHVNSHGDRGLLGIAVDSNFASNHYLWLLYTYEPDPSVFDGPKVSRLVRITVNPDNTVVNAGNPETAVLGTLPRNPETPTCPPPDNTIDCIPSEDTSHSIGTVRSAPDGTLWVGSGDGAGYGGLDPLAFRTYDEQSMAGKIMHITRTGQGVAGHPFCSGDSNLDHVCTKLYAKGFRNPYRFTLRPGGGIFATDVGWETREEVDLVAAGKDYGWPCYEGTIRTPTYSSDARCDVEYSRENTPSAAVGPVADFLHADGAVAFVAGPVYNGTGYPAGYSGSMFFGDYGSGELRRLVTGPGGNSVSSWGSGAFGWVSLEPAPDNGDVIAVDFGDGDAGGGALHRISYTTGNTPPSAVAHSDVRSGVLPLAVQFSGGDSTDPDTGEALTYDWDFGDGSPHAGGANASHTYTARGSHDAVLTVTDSQGASATDVVRVVAGGPAVTIDTPSAGSTYRDGVAVALSGSATDASGTSVPSYALVWQVKLHHKTHVHELGTFYGATASFSPLVDHDADSHYDVTLTATAHGLTGSRTVTVVPETASFTLTSTPAGAPLTYGGADSATRTSMLSAVGFHTTVSAADQFRANGRDYRFDRWSDGLSSPLHDVTIQPSTATLTAQYTDVTPPPAPVSAPADPPASAPLAPDPGLPLVNAPMSLRLRPRLAQSLRASRPVVRGTAIDRDGLRSVYIALRGRRDVRGCRWWSSRLGRLTRVRTSCANPLWLRAWMAPGVSAPWAVPLGATVPAGSYVLSILGVDANGNTTRRLADGRDAVLFAVAHPRRRARASGK